MAQLMLNIALQAFHEDKQIIEAQQRIMATSPDREVLPLPADRGPLLFQRIHRRLVQEEASIPVSVSTATSTKGS